MSNFNKVVLVGNLVTEPELKEIGDSNLVRFRMAINRRYTTKSGEKKEDSTFIDCEMWGPRAGVIAEYVKRDPLRLEGWASINPTREDALEKFQYAVDVLGLKGLKVGPTYQHFDPSDSKYWTLFTECERRDLPVMIHMGTTYPSAAKIALSQPLLLEPLIMAHPNLRMIIAHLGHPWESDTIALIRKSPNIFSDISALHFRPWRFYQALITAVEYGVTHKLLLGSDFANSTIDDAIKGLRNVNSILEGTKLPQIPEYVIDNIIYENWKRFFNGKPN
jgi:predicted TIM-barrel fold metal-dependent hydrolase